MEYDKHIKRLVLGYLKSECKAAYKIFFKSHFQNESRHVATRVAGQTLEDILKVYSRVQDIVQGRLEDTEYYKEYGTEVSSPTYLVEQLLYLLERDRVSTPTSTIRDRSPEPTSANEIYQNEADCANITDIETTPEYTLPGNVVNETENFKSTTPYRRYSPVFRTPYLQQLPSTEQQNISSTVSKKLLRNRELPIKLAHNINTAYLSRQKELADSKPSGIEYEERVIKSVIDKTEADPMFEELLDDLLGTVGSTLEKAIGPGMAVSSSSSTRTESPSPFKHTTDVNQPTNTQTQLESEPIETTANQQTEISETRATIEHQETESRSNNEKCQDENEKQSVIIQSEVVIQPPSEDRVTMSTSSQCSMQPPQLIIVNQPLVIPQPLSVLQSVSSILQPNGKGSQFCGMLTAQDIMQAPVVLNEISADGSSMTPGNTPLKLGDVKDIREYLSIFTVNTPKKNKSRNKRNNSMSLLKPTPTIKVEIFNSLLPVEIPKNEFPHASKHSSQLPDLSDFVADDGITRKDSIADVPEAKRSTPNENKIPPQETTKPRSLGSIHTPSPVVNSIPKPTNKSSSHVRNLTFPSPIRKTNEKNEPTSLTIMNKQQASKDLFKEPEEAANNTVEETLQKKSESKPRKVSKKSPKKIEKSQKQVTKSTTLKKSSALWDAELRKLATTGEPEEPVAMSRKTKRRLQKEAELLEVDAKKLEDALKTPGKPEPLPKQKIPSSKSKTLKEKAAKVKTERISSQVEVEKKVISPSKIYNTANKRNMDIDGITPKNAKEGSTQLVSHARKNITGLLVTPLKEEDSPTQNITKEASSDTPFTPMLKANLQGFAVGDNFTIDTPNFPITPGMSLMEHPTPAYCILNDTETNKATEAIVLSEEKKSSVRKTDDEDVIVVSPKVYGTTEILEEFNKSRAGKKNLDLLGNKAVSWDSDVEENNSSTSNEGPNGTVIQNVKKDETASMRITRSSGKSLSMLKSQMLNSSVCFDETTDEVRQEMSEVKKTSPLKSEAKPTASIEKGTSSGDSEITSKDTYKKRISSELVSPNVQPPVVKKKPTKEKRKKEPKSKKELSNEGLSSGEAELLNDTIKNTESTPKLIKNVFLNATSVKTSSHLINEFSVKAEIDEKRKRVIELDKFMSAQSAKTPSRRRSGKLLPRSCLSGQSSSKRKKSSPRRLVKRVAKKKTTSEESDSDSQDEFFKQSGSNLHRTNKQARSSERLKARNSRLESKEDAGKEMEKSTLNEVNNESNIQASKDENSKKPNTPENPSIAEQNSTLWDDCVIELQTDEISVVYDEKTTSKKSFKDYDLTVLTKAIQLDVPLADDTEQTVQISATPFKILWHFPPVSNIKNVSGSNVKNDDCAALNDCIRSLIESNSDSEHGTKLSDTNDHKTLKKRKHRSDSCSSSSSKKLKVHLHPKFEDSHIKNVLTMLHGPSEKS